MAERVDVASVELWGDPIGAVAWDPVRAMASFEYTEQFIRSSLEVAPLMMPVGTRVWSFPELSKAAFRGLPGMLADSLPDRWGTSLSNTWLARQGRAPGDFNPVERLCYVGSRGIGALEYMPAVRGLGGSDEVGIDELTQLAIAALDERGTLSTSLDDDGLATLLRVGTSAGGVRAKAVIAWNPVTGSTRSGQMSAPEGYEYWIIKFDGVGSTDGTFLDPEGYGRVEYAYHLMATDCGIDTTPARLHVDGAGRAHFMTKRFDRTDDGDRIHIQTLQAIAHLDYNEAGAHSWEEALRITLQLCGAADTEELYRRMVFNVVARNQDDHTKNISFMMDRAGTWSLTPAYDVTWAYSRASERTRRHQMTIAGKRDGFTATDLKAVGTTFGIRRPERILERAIAVVSQWDRFSEEAGVDESLHIAIASSLRLGLMSS